MCLWAAAAAVSICLPLNIIEINGVVVVFSLSPPHTLCHQLHYKPASYCATRTPCIKRPSRVGGKQPDCGGRGHKATAAGSLHLSNLFTCLLHDSYQIIRHLFSHTIQCSYCSTWQNPLFSSTHPRALEARFKSSASSEQRHAMCVLPSSRHLIVGDQHPSLIIMSVLFAGAWQRSWGLLQVLKKAVNVSNQE